MKLFSRRSALLVIAGWLLLIGALSALAPSLNDVKDNGGDGPPASSMSARADQGGTPPAVIVIRSESAASTEAAAARVTDAVTDAGLPSVGRVTPADRTDTAQMLVVSLKGNDFRDDVTSLRTIVADAAGDAEVAVTGPAGTVVDAAKVFGGSDKVLLLGTIALVVVLLFAIYRSPALVVVSLLGVGVAMQLAQGVGALLADVGVITISAQTASIMTVLLFGVGTDYALIIFARYQEALAAESDPQVAMATAMRSVTEALLASVSTIVAAVLALLVAVTPVLHDFGPYLAIGVLSMGLVAFTLTPALLVLCGRVAFWPRRNASVPESRFWKRFADLVIAAPRRVLA
ncbi:MAG: hypothetical protein EOO74_08395, partial [Myxococcales bacterium]